MGSNLFFIGRCLVGNDREGNRQKIICGDFFFVYIYVYVYISGSLIDVCMSSWGGVENSQTEPKTEIYKKGKTKVGSLRDTEHYS